MPFAWRQFEPSQVGRIEKYDIPLNDWLGVKFGEGMASGLGRAIWDMGEDMAWDTGEKVAPEILNKSFAIEGHLTFKEPTTIGRAYLVSERKKEELERLARLQSASHSAASGKAFAGFLAGLVGGFANPVDLGTAFIPFVGSAEKAGRIARMGKGLLGAPKYGAAGQALQAGRAALARGVVTQEAIGAGRGASLTGSIIDGVLSQAAVEVPIAIEKARNQADYTAKDSLFNVLAGGLFAGGLNFAGQAIEVAYKRAIKSAVEFHSRMSVEGKEALFREHEDAFVSGKTPDTAGIIRIDEAAIRSKVEAERFDAEAAKMEGMRNPETWAEIRGEVTTSLNQATEALAKGEIEPAVKAIQMLPTSGEMVGSGVEIFQLIPKLKNLIEQLPDLGRVMVDDRPFAQWLNDVEVGQVTALPKFTSLTDEQLKKIVASKRPESFKKAAANILESRALAQTFPPEARIEAERNKRIAEFIEKKRKEWQDGLEGRVDEAKRAEIARQQAEGKLLSTEDAKRYEATATANKADLEILKQDVENLDEEFRAIPGVKQKAGMPAEAKAKTAKTPDTIYEMSQDQYAVWLSEGKGKVAGQGAVYKELVKKPEYRQGGKEMTKAEASEAGLRLEELEKTKGFKASESGWTFIGIGDSKTKLPDGSRLKAYVTLKNWKDLTPELLKKLADALKKAGYNGQVKVPGAAPFNQWRLVEAFDNIVAHVKDEASLSIFQKEASAIFKDAQITFGKDSPKTSHTDLLATIVNERMVDVKTGKNPPELKLEERPIIETEAAPVTARTPQDVGLTQAEIDEINKELEALDMTTIPSQAKAVKAAAPCAARIK